jgi:hypothetical protein
MQRRLALRCAATNDRPTSFQCHSKATPEIAGQIDWNDIVACNDGCLCFVACKGWVAFSCLDRMARLEALIDVLDRSKKRIAIAFALAILLHLPATPLMPVLRLVHRLHTSNTPPISTQEAPPREVEVELREVLRNEEQRKEQQQTQPEAPQVPAPPPPPGVKFAASAPVPKADPDSTEKAKEPKPEKEKVKDVGLEGMNKKMVGKPGVSLGVWFSSLRDNPIGKRFGELVACDREWKVFLDQGIDLLRDFDGALVVGPSLLEPRQMTVAVRHSLPSERVHEVVDGIVRQSGTNGRWVLNDVATVRLGKTQRMLLPQQSDLFFVAPSKGWESLHDVKQPLRVPTAEGRLMSLVLAPPHKVFERIGLALPKRIREMRLEVYANTDQSVDVRVELEDASHQAAERDVKQISTLLHDFFADAWLLASTLGTLTGSNDEAAPLELAPRLDLSVDDKVLTGMIHLSPSQTKTTLELAASILCRKSKRGSAKPKQ